MIDEKDVAERFHSTFDARPSAGAAQRLRSALLEADDPRLTQPRAMPHGLHLSLRIMAALALIAVAMAASGAFLVLHRSVTQSVPANQSSTSHATARSSWGMVSATVGWQESSWFDFNGLHHILRTTDAGAHWIDVSPPANLYVAAARGSAAVPGSTSVYVLDGDHVWLGQIASGAGSFQIATLGTADGGRTWEGGESFRADGPNSPNLTLYFLDANHGWMLLQFFGVMSFNVASGEQNQLYRTTDGGITWREIAHVDATATNGEQVVNALCSWQGVAFASPDDGWLMQVCRGTNAGMDLLISHDGGFTWSPQVLPPAIIPSHSYCVGLPVVFDRTHAELLAELPCPDGHPAPNAMGYVLLTADGGLSWAAREIPLGAVHFLDSRHAWLVSDTLDLYRTTDGGLTWSEVRVSPPFGLGDDMYFVDPRNGFAMVSTNAGGDPTIGELWKTTDGGQTWSRVGPMPPRGY
jgi:photosystem II stability/assembly factor-like uncharacterized protein